MSQPDPDSPPSSQISPQSGTQAGTGRFLTGPTMGHVVRMTATGAAGITFVFIVDAANLFWISRLGDASLVAAIGYAFAIQFFSVSIGVGMMIGCTALVSRSIGLGARQEARHQATAAMLLAVAVLGLTAALVVAFRFPLLSAVGAEGETLARAARYLALTVPSLALMAVGLCGSAVLRAEGYGAKAMYVTLGSGAVMMLLDPVLIVGLGLGLDGAAASIWIFRILMASLALWFAARQLNLLARPSWAAIRRTAPPMARISGPTIVTQMAGPFGNYLLTSVLAGFGDNAVAAWAVIGRLTVVAFGGLFSLSGAIGGIFGQNFGAQQYDRLRQTYRDALIFCVLYTAAMWLVLMALSQTIANGFGLTADAADLLWAFTHFGALAMVVGGALFVANSAFNTLGKPGRATLLSWLKEGLLTLPAALWLSGIFGAAGAVYAQALVGVVVGLLAGVWGWRFVATIGQAPVPKLDLATRRAYRDVNRYRRR